jgi:hypothetical protein
MRHDGPGESILRALCTDEQARELESMMITYGGRVTAHGERETPEQTAERRNTLSLLGGERVFPCIKCPECAWFNPHLESLCGAGIAPGGEGWEDAVISTAMEMPKHRSDFEQCPLREGVMK